MPARICQSRRRASATWGVRPTSGAIVRRRRCPPHPTSGAVLARSRSLPDRRFVLDRDAAAPQRDPALRLPALEVLVHHLARDTEKRREVLLRDPERHAGLAALTVQLGKAQEPLRESR